MNNNEAHVQQASQAENKFSNHFASHLLKKLLKGFVHSKYTEASLNSVAKVLYHTLSANRDYADSWCRIETTLTLQYKDGSSVSIELDKHREYAPIALNQILPSHASVFLKEFGFESELYDDFYSAILMFLSDIFQNVKTLTLSIRSLSPEEAQAVCDDPSEYPEHTFEVFSYNVPNR